MYTQTSTGEEHYSSVDEILHWISSGPVLRPPSDSDRTEEIDVTITTPAYIPATIQYVPTTPHSQHTPFKNKGCPFRTKNVPNPTEMLPLDDSAENKGCRS